MQYFPFFYIIHLSLFVYSYLQIKSFFINLKNQQKKKNIDYRGFSEYKKSKICRTIKSLGISVGTVGSACVPESCPNTVT